MGLVLRRSRVPLLERGDAHGWRTALRSGVEDFVWTDERILFFWIAAPLVALFFTVGVISSMRWAGRQWRQVRNNRGARKLNAKYSTMARANKPLPFVPPAAPFPLRNEKGPRDWSPAQSGPESSPVDTHHTY